MPKIYISVCSYNRPMWPMMVALQNAILYASNYDITCTVNPLVEESLISRARNDALANFLETDADYLMTIDDDIEIPPDSIYRLGLRNRDIIGGIYRAKRDPYRIAQRSFPPTGPEAIEKGYYANFFTNKRCLQFMYVSSGCMLIKRAVILGLRIFPELKYNQNFTGREQFALYMPMVHNNEYLSEDWAFCQRARSIGFETWADGGVICNHYGTTKIPISMEDIQTMEKGLV